MITLRKADERGYAAYDWLETYHTFSFNTYRDPEHVHYRKIRVINDDIIAPAGGFPTHPHDNMEIITYVVEGALAHKDSMGNHPVIRAGEVQCMTAGTGITHSEFNHSSTESVRLLQIWIFPEAEGLSPNYAQREFPRKDKLNQWCLIVSNDGRANSLKIYQDVSLFATILAKGQSLFYTPKRNRYLWIQMVSGELRVNNHEIHHGDALAISDEQRIDFEAVKESEFLLFDLA